MVPRQRGGAKSPVAVSDLSSSRWEDKEKKAMVPKECRKRVCGSKRVLQMSVGPKECRKLVCGVVDCSYMVLRQRVGAKPQSQ